MRTRNAPQSEYAEWLVAGVYNLKLMRPGHPGYDAEDPSSKDRYEIKGVLSPGGNRPSLGNISGLVPRKFDYLVVVFFAGDYTVNNAYKIPHEVIVEHRRRLGHKLNEGFQLHLASDLIGKPGVESIGGELRRYQIGTEKIPYSEQDVIE